MLRGQINTHLPLGHSIIATETIEIKMAAVSMK